MAAAMTMDREPEVARFIDSYKYDQDMATRRDRYGGGTSLPLNSDGYEEKQQRLRDERHKDWLVQQDKAIDHPPSIAKHPFTGPVAAGPQSSADYDEEIQRMTDRYHNRYNEQRQMEQQKYEARRRSPPRPAQPPGPQMDYNLAGEQARAEERRAYQDYMGKYQSSYIPTKVPLDYEENKKILNEERRREYNEMMEQKAKEERYWAMRGRPVTPPGGLDIGKYDRQLKETAQQKKKEYKEMLDQQQREHMYLRARQEPEMAVIDRNAAQPSQYLANKPPPGPSYGKGRDEAEERRRQDEMRLQQQMSKPAELVKNPYYSSDDYEKFQREIQRKQGEEYRDFLAKSFQPLPGSVGLPLGQYKYEPKRLIMEAERNSEWNKLSKEKLAHKHEKPEGIDDPQGLNIDVNYHRRKQAWLEKQRNKDYNEHISKRTFRQKAPTPPELQGLPIGQQNYEPMHKAMEYQRNREYNEFLRKKYGGKGTLRSTRSEPPRGDQNEPKSSFYYGNEMEHEEKRKVLDAERRNEYNQFIKELDPPRSRSIEIPSDADSGLPIGQQHHEAWRKFLRNQRNKEYNQLVDMQKYTNPSRRHDFVDTASGPYGGLFHGLGEHGNKSDVLNKERQQEYNDRLDHQFGKDRPSGRPNWVKETLPNNTDRGRSPMKSQPPADQYQQMLDEKRREEASRRRFEDPEYQDRLAQGRDRGEAGGRYGY